jgi:hypothetical protein
MFSPKQMFGAHAVLPGTVALIFTSLFEGNLDERSGAEADDYDDAKSSVLVTINRVLASGYGTGVPTTLRSVARVTWGSGRGGAGNNQALVDVGAGGTRFSVSATNFLKIEVAHQVIGTGAPATFDLSWVANYAGPTVPAFFTNQIGAVVNGARSVPRLAVPAYAFRGTTLVDANGGPPVLDSIGFYPGPVGALLYDWPAYAVPAPVAAEAEFFDVANRGSAPGNYRAIWELRL